MGEERRVTNGVAARGLCPSAAQGLCSARLPAAAPSLSMQLGGNPMNHWLRCLLAAGALLAGSTGALAAETARDDHFEMTAGNLLVVLRETPGANKQDESPTPFGKISARAAD